MRSARAVLALWLVVTVVGIAVPGASAQEAVVVIPVHEARILSFPNVQRVLIAAPEVADVNVVTAHDVVILAKRIGDTTLSVWTSAGLRTYHVVVISAAPEDVVKAIRDALREPDVRVRVTGDTIILEGSVSTDAAKAQAEQLASGFGRRVVNLLTVRQPTPQLEQRARQALSDYPDVTVTATAADTVRIEGVVDTQYDVRRVEMIAKTYAKNVTMLVRARKPVEVQIAAVVAEINRTALNDLGIQYGGNLPTTPGSLLTTSYVLNFGLFQAAGNPVQALQTLIAQIHLLEQRNAARTLANPRLVVSDGDTAKMLVGGEVPIPVVGTTTGQVTITFKQFGIRLEFKPVVEPDAPIRLDLLTEVSSLDFTNAVIESGFTIPSFKTRRAETSVAMRPGQYLVIGGLLQREDTKLINKIPILGDIPILGALFRSTRFQRNETELVIFIVPTLVAPTTERPATPEVPNPEDLNP